LIAAWRNMPGVWAVLGLESVIYVVRGRARMRWGERLEFVAEAGPGDFIYVLGDEFEPLAPPHPGPPAHNVDHALQRAVMVHPGLGPGSTTASE
jgi:uncharacterized RmlC-like cupin family protein